MLDDKFFSIRLIAQLNNFPASFFQEERLKKASEILGKRIVRGFDIKEGMINAYHKKAWEHAYPSMDLVYE